MGRKFWRGLAGKVPILLDLVKFILVLAIVYFSVGGVLVLACRTETPWMAVASDSMKHVGGDAWKLYFTQRLVVDPSDFPIQGGLERGDMLILRGVSVKEIEVGDVIVADVGDLRMPRVHRVIEILQKNGEISFKTKGDNPMTNTRPDREEIKPWQVKGEVIFVLPKLGWLSLWWQGE